MKFKILCTLTFMLAITLGACTNITTPPISSPLPTLSNSISSPQLISPITAPPSLASPETTPQPGLGLVIGQLIDIRTGQPAYKTLVYLEPTINHQAPPLLYGPLNGESKTDSLPNGDFVLNNVPPGEYILALYSPFDILYYQKPEGNAVIIQVTAGAVVDLGRVVYFIP